MTQDPRLRTDISAGQSTRTDNVQGRTTSIPNGARDVATVARTLAAYGNGAVAFDLALDLVLNEVVEEARRATGATGAAIALARDGAMECRATTGQHAPDLGVRVETEAGLSGACLRSGEIQHCADTETDPRVDARACRQLGVRSMLIVPVSDGSARFGILEVLSSRPDAFSARDIEMLKVLAQRIVVSKLEAEEGSTHTLVSVEEDPHGVGIPDRSSDPAPNSVTREAMEERMEPGPRGDVWTTVLVVLVIATAVTLGVLIGWRGAANKRSSDSRLRAKPESVQSTVSAQATQPLQQPSTPSTVREPAEVSAVTPPSRSARAASAGAGGLLVTENGKVVYREGVEQRRGSAAETSGRIIHRVDPEYPMEARNRGIQGPVVLDVQVLRDGTVGTIGIASGDPLLAEAAVHAVRQWKYQPNVVNGRPIECQTRIKINFTLPPS